MLYEKIKEAMETDDADTEAISARLTYKYSQLDPDARKVMDDFFVTLTGWSIATLMRQAK